MATLATAAPYGDPREIATGSLQNLYTLRGSVAPDELFTFRKGALVGIRPGTFRLLEVVLDGTPRADLDIVGVYDDERGQIDPVTSVGSDDEALDDFGSSIRVKVRDGDLGNFDTGTGANEILAEHIGRPCYAKNDNTVWLTDDGGALSFAGLIAGVSSRGKVTVRNTWDIRQQWKLTNADAGLPGHIDLGPGDFYLLTGDPLAVFANGASAVPGSALVDSKAFAVRWNNNGTLDAVMTSFRMPEDCDIAFDMTVSIYASKTGATLADAVTFAVGAYNQVTGALHDADSNYGSTSSAMDGDAAAKTIQVVTVTLAAANLAASPASVTITVKPTDGTLGTDDLVLHGVRIEYTKKLS